MVVVSNSSPIIHLVKINKLYLLERMYGQIFVPNQVYLECTETRQYHEEVKFISAASWIDIVQIKDIKLFKLLYSEIDAGEAEALVLAFENNADLVLLDDMEARSMARRLEFTVTGTLGVLLKAKKQGIITSLKEDISKLESTGFWISSDLKARFLAQE